MGQFEKCTAPEENDLAITMLGHYRDDLSVQRLRGSLKQRQEVWDARKFQLDDQGFELSPQHIAACTLARGFKVFRFKLERPADEIEQLSNGRAVHNALSFIALADLYDKVLWQPENPAFFGGVMEVKKEGVNSVRGIECHLHVDPRVAEAHFGQHIFSRQDPHIWYKDTARFVRRELSSPEPEAEPGVARVKVKAGHEIDSLDMLTPYVRFPGPQLMESGG